jgi:ribosome-binding factor A
LTAERRKLQLESLLLRSLQARMAKGLSDPRIRGLVTVTRLELSADLRRAKAFISVMPHEHAELTMHGLRAATGKVRRDVMEGIHLKEMPTLEFVYDDGLKAQLDVIALLAKDRLEKEARGEAGVDDSGTQEDGGDGA